MINKFTVLNLIDLDLKDHDALNFKCLAGRKGLNSVITDPEINRPGLTLSGFFEKFAYHRIQMFGRGEMAYLQMLEENGQMEAIEKMFTYNISCCVFSHSPFHFTTRMYYFTWNRWIRSIRNCYIHTTNLLIH